MATTDPTDILLRHDAWATRTVLHLCEKLTREQFHQKFPIGLGSLHENLTHIISATRRWTDRLAGRTPRPMLHSVPKYPHIPTEAMDRTPAELLKLLDVAERDLAATVQASRASHFADTVHLDWPGEDGTKKRYTFTHGAVIVHICTHAMHHRAQCLNMLKHLSVPGVSDKLPDPSVTDWVAEVETPAVVV
ncbi:MAG TPA: DinB family protein [Phycisphaerales bacterium]|nr:DinB family protein [Phycisphaerales bacterium]